MSDVPEQVRHTLTALFDAFDGISQLCRELTAQQWEVLSELPGWTVKDLLSHLVAMEHFMQGHGRTRHRAADLSVARNPIGERNEHEVDARRSLPGADVARQWFDIIAERRATLTTADAEYFAQPADTPVGPGTVGDFLSVRVLDCWVHEQDMRRAAGVPGHLGGAAAEHTIDRLLRTLPIVVGKRAATPEGGVVIFRCTGEVTRTVILQIIEGRARVLDAPPVDHVPLCDLTMSTAAFVVLANGRGGPDHPDVTGAWSVSGDAALGRRIVEQLNMMI